MLNQPLLAKTKMLIGKKLPGIVHLGLILFLLALAVVTFVLLRQTNVLGEKDIGDNDQTKPSGDAGQTKYLLSGKVYHDVNGDKQYQEEEGIPDIKVTVKGKKKFKEETATDAGGVYSFNVISGKYTVSVASFKFLNFTFRTRSKKVEVTNADISDADIPYQGKKTPSKPSGDPTPSKKTKSIQKEFTLSGEVTAATCDDKTIPATDLGQIKIKVRLANEKLTQKDVGVPPEIFEQEKAGREVAVGSDGKFSTTTFMRRDYIFEVEPKTLQGDVYKLISLKRRVTMNKDRKVKIKYVLKNRKESCKKNIPAPSPSEAPAPSTTPDTPPASEVPTPSVTPETTYR